jgi:hypothetical protein
MSIRSKKSVLIYGTLGILFFTIGFLLCLTLVGMIVGFPMIGIGLAFFTMVDRIKKTETRK